VRIFKKRAKKQIATQDETASKKFNTGLLLDNSAKYYKDYQDEADILHQKIADKGVNNIAVVASFGAGKSSAIETYLSLHRSGFCTRNTYTRISLASFNDTDFGETEIEKGILQQLLYSQPKRKLPNSEVKRTTSTSWWKTAILSILALLFIASVVLFGLQVGGVYLYDHINIAWVFLLIAGIAFLVLAGLAIHFKKIRGFKYKDFEIEVKKGEEDARTGSLINKFVDEVLYFFESTRINLVIFEDLDRLADDKSSAIFVKLRELNTIINNCHQRRGKVTFLYAVKDDMIKSQEERAKFFEFILPIVPILNPVTKAIKLHEEHTAMVRQELGLAADAEISEENLEKSELRLDGEFMNLIATYITDMRTLKNAFNDYIITRSRVFKHSPKGRLSNENLFALSLYKNLYPYDYAQLQQGRGIIPIVMTKAHLIADEVEAARAEIKRFEGLLEDADKEHLQNFGELKLLLRPWIQGNAHPTRSTQLLDYEQLGTFQGIDFNQILNPSSNNYYNYVIAWKAGFDSKRWVRREQVILAKTAAEKERISKLIEEQRKIIDKFESMRIYDLIKRRGVDFHFSTIGEKETTKAYLKELEDVALDDKAENNQTISRRGSKQLGFIKFLLQNDYIDELYMEYTSSYKSSELSEADDEFIRKVQQGEEAYSLRIDNIGHVFDRLREASFLEPSIVNKTVLANLNLLKTKSERSGKYSNIKKLLSSEAALKAVTKYIQSNEDESVLQAFFAVMLEDNHGFCERVLGDSTLSPTKKLVLVKTLINTHDSYKGYDAEGKLSEFVGLLDNYEEFFGTLDLERVKKFLLDITPRFEKLGDSENAITKFAIENNLYRINVENLEAVLTPDKAGDFYGKNYAFITTASSAVKGYIDSKIDEYIKNVFGLEEFENKNESIEIVLDLLNREGVIQPQKVAIIKKYSFVIDDIDKYAEGLYFALLEHDRVKPTWTNIIFAYLSEDGFSGELKDFIIRNADTIEGEFEYAGEEQSPDPDTGMERDICEEIFVALANAEYKIDERAELKTIADKIGTAYDLSEEYSADENLAIFIAEKNISYNSEALMHLWNKPKALCQFAATYHSEIDNDFAEFFRSVKPAELKTMILGANVPVALKQKLITEFGGIITEVAGFEKEYYKAITTGKLQIPVVLLMRFKDATQLSREQKLDLAVLCSDKEQSGAIQLFSTFMQVAMPILNDSTEDAKIEFGADEYKGLFELFARIEGREFSKRGKTVKIKKKG